MKDILQIEPGKPMPLPEMGQRPTVEHVFEKADLQAIALAMAAGRPLLVRGDPGVGKSQLARAAAHVLGRAFVSRVIDARTEPRDLLYRYDAVRRLAAAQIQRTSGAEQGAMDETNFITPGPLWWAFEWGTAEEQAKESVAPWHPPGWVPEAGVVVLLDEIDKADASVPNGLLEALGEGRFEVLGRKDPVTIKGAPPFMVITTNEERALPNAFLRRCMVHHMQIGRDVKQWLVARGAAHFPKMNQDVLVEAAEQLARDREDVRAQGLTPPGQAEYLDLLRGVSRLASTAKKQRALLKELSRFAFRKHRGEPGGGVLDAGSETEPDAS